MKLHESNAEGRAGSAVRRVAKLIKVLSWKPKALLLAGLSVGALWAVPPGAWSVVGNLAKPRIAAEAVDAAADLGSELGEDLADRHRADDSGERVKADKKDKKNKEAKKERYLDHSRKKEKSGGLSLGFLKKGHVEQRADEKKHKR